MKWGDALEVSLECLGVTCNLINMSVVMHELLSLESLNVYVIVCIAVSSVNPAKLKRCCSLVA